MSVEERYRRLLRWYPAAWRAENEEVVLGTLLDQADHLGRERPQASEAWMLRISGVGERLTLTSAAVAAGVAVVFAALGILTPILGAGPSWMSPALVSLGMGAPLTFAVVALLRDARALSPARAVAVMLASLPAWALAALSALSWAIGSEEADAGAARSALGGSFLALFAAGWVAGGIAVLLATTGVTASLPVVLRVLIGGVAAIVLPPLLGLGVAFGATGAMAATAVLVLIGVRMRRAHPADVETASRTAAAPEPLGPPARRTLTVTLVAVGGVSLLGALFALFGSAVAPVDGTRAMQLGLAVGQFALIPLVVCAGFLIARRSPARAAISWLCTSLIAVGVTWYALEMLTGAGGDGGYPWIAMPLIAAGLGGLLVLLLRMPAVVRWPTALVIAVLAAVPGWALLQGIGFLLPIVTIALLPRPLRRPRPAPAVPVAA